MTNLTFAELTALIAANGLTINDRYFITDKNWTIIAIATNAYRVVVPIVTEVTFAQLEALVAANGLNEGLQYKVTDKNWLLLAISNNQLKPLENTIIIKWDEPYESTPTLKYLPDFIIANSFAVDSGIIDYDISESTGVPISNIIITANTTVNKVYVHFYQDSDPFTVDKIFGTPINFEVGEKDTCFIIPYYTGNSTVLSATGVSNTNRCRIYVLFERVFY